MQGCPTYTLIWLYTSFMHTGTSLLKYEASDSRAAQVWLLATHASYMY